MKWISRRNLCTFLMVPFLMLPLSFNLATENDHVFNFSISNDSKIIIGGSTNVNDFDCYYEGVYENNELRVTSRSDGLKLYLKNAIFNLNVKEFDCQIGLMTREFQETLKAEDYPLIKMEILRVEFLDDIELTTPEIYVNTQIKVIAAGKTKIYNVKTKRKIDAQNHVSFIGNFNILVEDFGIEPPSKAFGLIKVNSLLNINYNLIFDL